MLARFYVACSLLLTLQLADGQRLTFSWKLDLLRLDDSHDFQHALLSTSKTSLISDEVINKPSIPNDETQNSKENFTAVAHVVSAVLLDGNTISGRAMRSLLSSTDVPSATMLYPSKAGEYLDSGGSSFNVRGLVYNCDSQQDSHNPCLLFPLPIDKYSSKVYFTLPSQSFGYVTISSIREVFHASSYTPVNEVKVDEVAASQSESYWVSQMRSNAFMMAYYISDDYVVVSADEFKSSQLNKVENFLITTPCPKTPASAIPLQRGNILYLSKKAGAVLLNFTGNGWEVMENAVTFGGDDEGSCVDRVTLSPPLFSKNIIVVSTQRNIFMGMDTQGKVQIDFHELRDMSHLTACEFIEQPTHCEIVDHTFHTTSCCKIFVLIRNVASGDYILISYAELLGRGEWRELKKFSGQLPLVPDQEKPVFINDKTEYSDQEIKIIGMSTLDRPDGTLYMWGTVLFVYDIRSGVLAWMHTFLPPNPSNHEGDFAVQFTSANEKGLYGVLTKNGAVWLGSAHPFARWFLETVRQVARPGSHFVAIFFDAKDDLYGLTKKSTATGVLSREKIPQEEEHSGNCNRDPDCPRMTIACEAKSSVYHVSHTLHTRTRRFSLQPPQLTGERRPAGDKTMLMTYLTVMEDFFDGQKINVPKWWEDEGDGMPVQNDASRNQWWYVREPWMKKHRKYLAMNSLFPNETMAYISEDQYKHQTVTNGKNRGNWNEKICSLPSTIYLDRNQQFRFNVSVEHPKSATCLAFENLRMGVMMSDTGVVDVTTVKHARPFDVLYEVVLTGKETTHQPPGQYLSAVSVSFSAWNPPSRHSDHPCCSSVSEGTAYERELLVKVGCPPGRRLKFDPQRSLDILLSRGRTDDFKCLYDAGDGVPCFTTSEFVAAFYVEDLVTGESSHFVGNYTLQVVGGGTGYLSEVREYTAEEVTAFNYRPGDSKSLLSLIWSVSDELDAKANMRDENTGRLILDANNPPGITFECRLDSPCGNIPFGASNPGEFYLLIEVSNKGVDFSTNCDYTMRFIIHLIGVELSPRIHLLLMIVTLSILVVVALSYYFCRFTAGCLRLRKFLKIVPESKDSDSEDDFAEPPEQFRHLLNRRMTLTGTMQNPAVQGGPRRTSLLAQSLLTDGAQKRKSSVKVAGLQTTRSNMSRVSNRTLDGAQ